MPTNPAATGAPSPADAGPADAGQTVTVILAAGAGRRLGGRPKALIDWEGEPLIARILRAFHTAGISDLAVVTGAWHHDVIAALEQLQTGTSPVQIVHNPDWATGQASSVRVAVHTARERHWPRLLLSPVDLPGLDPAVIARIAAQAPDRIAQPVVGPVPTHPVAIPSAHFAALEEALRAGPPDRGAGPWLRGQDVDLVAVDDLIDTAPQDVDVPADLPPGS